MMIIPGCQCQLTQFLTHSHSQSQCEQEVDQVEALEFFYYRRALFFRELKISREEITREYISRFLNFVRENRNPVTPFRSRMYMYVSCRCTYVRRPGLIMIN